MGRNGGHYLIIEANIECPGCHGPMTPRSLGCDPCGLRLDGRFSFNEFNELNHDLLHFLRIFIHCEGRIKDMERSLGLSYPSVKSQIAKLKTALKMPNSAPEPCQVATERPAAADDLSTDLKPTHLQTLEQLERGDIGFTEALHQLRQAPHYHPS